MAEKIAAGVIGTGFIGPVHVEAGRRLGNVEFVALAEAKAGNSRDASIAIIAITTSNSIRVNPKLFPFFITAFIYL